MKTPNSNMLDFLWNTAQEVSYDSKWLDHIHCDNFEPASKFDWVPGIYRFRDQYNRRAIAIATDHDLSFIHEIDPNNTDVVSCHTYPK